MSDASFFVGGEEAVRRGSFCNKRTSLASNQCRVDYMKSV